ncbi:venom dipeptidyl peptidase 4 [Aricia agestis]|uniref:venom dipeptidyl peptidase 4 n=1 Tax=Aricia agestis TaxID=91739 RepID=UPI001C202F01|nr:venom dipeptidyl peptidase 4 [Aricia agestis]XP_041972904.1 venom dipeptidyl peptidase 4 [Aricia agestis]XP_041972905.1 venom dipeptidyl peptidase 4 [Aricia agestis]
MAQDSSNSTMEMGTSDQVLVATKKSKKLTYVIGAVAMVVVIGVVVALAVVLTGNDAEADAIISTPGPTIPTTISSTTVPPPTTAPPATTTEPPTEPPPEEPMIELEDIINGEFSTASFNGTWTSGNDVLFRNEYGDLVKYDVQTNSHTILVSNTSQILQQSFRVTELSADERYVVLSYNEESVYRYSFDARYSVYNIYTGEVTNIVPPGVEPADAILQNFIWGPSGSSLAFVYKNNIYYQAELTSTPVQITTTGQESVVYNGVPDWVYEEEVFASNNALWFSPDGARIAYATFDDTNVRIMKIPHFGIPGSVDYQYTRHREIRYPKPGTTNPTVSVTLRTLASNAQVVYSPPTTLDQPILKTVAFVANNAIAIMWTNRVQTSLSVQLCTDASNQCTQIYTYTEANGWIDNIPLIFNEQGNAFITILPQTVNNVAYKQIVQVSGGNAQLWTATNRVNAAHTVLEIMTWTADNVIWYKATHVNDTAEQHVYSVDGSGVITCFTCELQRPDAGSCLYNDAAISASGLLSINCAGPDVPQIFIHDTNGTYLRSWDDNARVSQLASTYTLPTTLRMSVPLGAGLEDADVLLQVPHNYLARTDVPLLVYVYGGPDTALVTKQWTVDWGTSLVSRYGIAVARIDGRGSGLKGVNNMFAVNRHLGSAEIEDQITVTRYLQQQLHWVDGNRTCIWGWSYGGYAASLALARGGDVFRCAIAVAPPVDWRFYDTIYTERYMDTPQNNLQAYSESSLLSEQVVEAYRNKRYFLVHGTEDDNVHYQHAMLISRLLQRRDVYFTQMSYTDEDHGLVGVRPHLYHSLEKFLRENML